MPALHESPVSSSPSGRITTLPILILNVHSRCNCRCVMCDIWKRETNDQVHARDLERHRASLENLGVRQVVLTGGEPLLHNELAALCTFFRDQKIHLTLLTTGLLLHKRAEEVAAFFDDIILSLDGPPEIHDAIRCVNGATNLIQKGVDLDSRTQSCVAHQLQNHGSEGQPSPSSQNGRHCTDRSASIPSHSSPPI